MKLFVAVKRIAQKLKGTWCNAFSNVLDLDYEHTSKMFPGLPYKLLKTKLIGMICRCMNMWLQTPDVFPKLVFGCMLRIPQCEDSYWLEPSPLTSYKTANANSTYATENKHVEHIRKVSHISTSLENARLPFLRLVVNYIYIYVQKQPLSLSIAFFIYRSEFRIEYHGWNRKRPCTEAKQTDCSRT